MRDVSPWDRQRRGHRRADGPAVHEEPHGQAVEDAGDVVPAPVPDVRDARCRAEDVAVPVEDVEGQAAGLAAVETVGAGEAVLGAAGDDVAPAARAALRPHDRLDRQARRGQLGGVGQADEGAAAEAQGPAPAGAGDPGRVEVVGRLAAAEAAVEAARPPRRAPAGRRARRSPRSPRGPAPPPRPPARAPARPRPAPPPPSWPSSASEPPCSRDAPCATACPSA